MNCLVHFLLAGDDDESRLGKLLATSWRAGVERVEHEGRPNGSGPAFGCSGPSTRSRIVIQRSIEKWILASEIGKAVRRHRRRVLRSRVGPSRTEHHPRPLSVYAQDVDRTLGGNLHRLPAGVHPLVEKHDSRRLAGRVCESARH